jgi:hypothetical protein
VLLPNFLKHQNGLFHQHDIIRHEALWGSRDPLMLFRTLFPHSTLEIHLECVLFVVSSTLEPQLTLNVGGIQDELDRIINSIVRRLFRHLPPPFFDFLEIRKVDARQVRSHDTTELSTICDSQFHLVERLQLPRHTVFQALRQSSSTRIGDHYPALVRFTRSGFGQVPEKPIFNDIVFDHITLEILAMTFRRPGCSLPA